MQCAKEMDIAEENNREKQTNVYVDLWESEVRQGQAGGSRSYGGEVSRRAVLKLVSHVPEAEEDRPSMKVKQVLGRQHQGIF